MNRNDGIPFCWAKIFLSTSKFSRLGRDLAIHIFDLFATDLLATSNRGIWSFVSPPVAVLQLIR